MLKQCGLKATSTDELTQPAVAKGGRAVATLVLMPGNETAIAAVRSRTFSGEVAASAWKGIMVVRLCAADGATLRRDLITVLGAVRGVALPRLWLN